MAPLIENVNLISRDSLWPPSVALVFSSHNNLVPHMDNQIISVLSRPPPLHQTSSPNSLSKKQWSTRSSDNRGKRHAATTSHATKPMHHFNIYQKDCVQRVQYLEGNSLTPSRSFVKRFSLTGNDETNIENKSSKRRKKSSVITTKKRRAKSKNRISEWNNDNEDVLLSSRQDSGWEEMSKVVYSPAASSKGNRTSRAKRRPQSAQSVLAVVRGEVSPPRYSPGRKRPVSARRSREKLPRSGTKNAVRDGKMTCDMCLKQLPLREYHNHSCRVERVKNGASGAPHHDDVTQSSRKHQWTGAAYYSIHQQHLASQSRSPKKRHSMQQKRRQSTGSLSFQRQLGSSWNHRQSEDYSFRHSLESSPSRMKSSSPIGTVELQDLKEGSTWPSPKSLQFSPQKGEAARRSLRNSVFSGPPRSDQIPVGSESSHRPRPRKRGSRTNRDSTSSSNEFRNVRLQAFRVVREQKEKGRESMEEVISQELEEQLHDLDQLLDRHQFIIGCRQSLQLSISPVWDNCFGSIKERNHALVKIVSYLDTRSLIETSMVSKSFYYLVYGSHVEETS